MDGLKEFLVNNYILITFIACILILSLIGYLSNNLKEEKIAEQNVKPIPEKIESVTTETPVSTPAAANEPTVNKISTNTDVLQEPVETEAENDAPNLGI